MLRVGSKPTTLLFERAKTVHALDSAATVIVIYLIWNCEKRIMLTFLTQNQIFQNLGEVLWLQGDELGHNFRQ
jgi:hypothetical protein